MAESLRRGARRAGVAPSPLLRALEARAPFEYATMALTGPLLARLATGDGHPVLVLPGYTADDRSTRPLRDVLRRQGYRTHGWRLGTNVGPTPEIIDGVVGRFQAVHSRAGRPVSLVGWSLGGIYARELARRFPDEVRQVITMGSPFRMVERERHEPGPLRVPTTAIYSRTDGIVRWQECIEADGRIRENIEVTGSHCGLGFNPAVVIAVSDRLAQPEGSWRPFRPTGLQRALFPTATRGNDRAA